jgi:hypothetical protein
MVCLTVARMSNIDLVKDVHDLFSMPQILCQCMIFGKLHEIWNAVEFFDFLHWLHYLF